MKFFNKIPVSSKYIELILYGIIGSISSMLDFVIYTALCYLSLYYLIANIISIHCGILCSFTLNRKYNFKVKNNVAKRFFSFYSIGLFGLGLSSLLLYVMVTIRGWNELFSKLIMIVVVAIIQFLLNKFITFKK
jgi:putative flippase GtrA